MTNSAVHALDFDGFAGVVEHDAVQAAVETAAENGDPADEHFDSVLRALASDDWADVPELVQNMRRALESILGNSREVDKKRRVTQRCRSRVATSKKKFRLYP
jgi:hypothetical protein